MEMEMSDGQMTRVDHTGKVSLEGWSWQVFESAGLDWDALISNAAAEAVENSLAETTPTFSMPFQWGPETDGDGGPAVSEPDAVYFSLPVFGDGSTSGPTWKTSISAMVGYFLGLFIHDTQWTDDSRSRCEALRDKLRALADEIDIELSEPNPRSKNGIY